MGAELNKDYTEENINVAINHMKGIASPSPYGLPTDFYQYYWDIVGQDLSNLALSILSGNGNVAKLNNTYIFLIPKLKNPRYLTDL